jgi:hypothetical protein
MTTLLGTLDDRLHQLLSPLLQINGWEVSSIVTEDFSNIQNFNALIEKYRTQLPGAFLSVPQIAFQTVKPRIPHFIADYQLLVGAQSRMEADGTRDFAFSFMERACGLMYLQQLQDYDLSCSLDYIRPRQFNFSEVPTDGGPLGVALLTFSIEVRNWEINSPA